MWRREGEKFSGYLGIVVARAIIFMPGEPTRWQKLQG
jgi:hypothetical protein